MLRKPIAWLSAGLLWLSAFSPAFAADQTPLKSVQATNGPSHPQQMQTGDTVGVPHGGTGATTLTAHGVLIGEGTTAVSATATGTSGQVLTSNGASADPSWQTASGGGGVGGGGALQLIATQTLGAAAASVTFNSIPGNFQDLVLVANGRSSTSAAQDDVWVRFNGDSGTHYSREFAGGTGTSPAAGQDNSANHLAIGTFSAATATANFESGFDAVFPNYAGTTFTKAAYAHSGFQSSMASGGVSATIVNGVWNSTAAISSETLTLASGANFVAGSTFQLYGRGGTPTATPATIPDLVVWWESDNVAFTANATKVPFLQNRAPNFPALSYNEANGNSRGVIVSPSTLNGLPVLNWANSSAGQMSVLSGGMNGLCDSGCTFFVVVNPNSVSATGAIIGGAQNCLEFRIDTTGPGDLQLVQEQTANIGNSTTNLAAGTWYQANVTYNPTSGAYAFRIAQAAAGSGTTAKSVDAGNWAIGYNAASTSENLNAQVALIIIYARVLTATEITTVETYIHTKWGV